jgi:phosphoglycolate phosphatase-like HAD superfamily hydrolase
MAYSRLVLFDIDGTLVWPDGIGRASMKVALEEVYGTAGPIDSYQFVGQTDLDTVSVLMSRAGLAPALIEERFPRIAPTMQNALARFVEEKRFNIRPCTGAPEVVAALAARPDALLGLITGNLRPTAEIKLRATGYDPSLFRVGAFGDLSAARADLPPHALAAASDLTGVEFSGKQVVIIGDTPADITCGRGVGARSIAVATGWISADDLRRHQPDTLFADLTDTQAVLDAIFAPV